MNQELEDENVAMQRMCYERRAAFNAALAKCQPYSFRHLGEYLGLIPYDMVVGGSLQDRYPYGTGEYR